MASCSTSMAERAGISALSRSDIHINARQKRKKWRDFTWVQSKGVDGDNVKIPSGEGEMWWSSEAGPKIKRIAEENAIAVEVDGLFKMRARVVPIAPDESRTYTPGYRSRVKMGAIMPVIGGEEKLASSHPFAADCLVLNFGLKREGAELEDPSVAACEANNGGGPGIVCRR
ncbi:putative Root cap [Cocos nucifera]|uniref:Putative Root cap n=1 Tax=Cocos nucifera TaxID=13894 RepID=A0A8K0IN48_COCNU|nr:putative Root cap [Cocos nucifera]